MQIPRRSKVVLALTAVTAVGIAALPNLEVRGTFLDQHKGTRSPEKLDKFRPHSHVLCINHMKKAAKRLGLVGLLVFTAKGLAWLLVPLVLAKGCF